ncbi:hypothetical protein GTW25_00330 [Aliihoeflea aestuarii]|jgi:hypothetical protein|uniref:hypothetical protein n=1 Tax=Aliihoeflea aestuarii TaxID=453840 RepID=UPI0020936680|nr:hypothetical protein [Aliihoeflea aestuarii]MCO6389475.1 hypothetical protein [Aliihoeflea aestuarii]
MSRHAFTPKHSIGMALRALLLAMALTLPFGYATQGEAGGQVFIEDASSQGGGIGFVLLMSLQRA